MITSGCGQPRSLGESGSAAVRPTLDTLSHDPAEIVRSQATTALDKLQKRGSGPARSRSRSLWDFVRTTLLDSVRPLIPTACSTPSRPPTTPNQRPPNKRMQRTKRHSAVGRRAPRAVVADLRFAADPQRSPDHHMADDHDEADFQSPATPALRLTTHDGGIAPAERVAVICGATSRSESAWCHGSIGVDPRTCRRLVHDPPRRYGISLGSRGPDWASQRPAGGTTHRHDR